MRSYSLWYVFRQSTGSLLGPLFLEYTMAVLRQNYLAVVDESEMVEEVAMFACPAPLVLFYGPELPDEQ